MFLNFTCQTSTNCTRILVWVWTSFEISVIGFFLANETLFYQYCLFSYQLLASIVYAQEKHEEIMAALANMEKRAVMAESMLEATIQYQSGQAKSQEPLPSPRYLNATLQSCCFLILLSGHSLFCLSCLFHLQL